MFDVFLGEWFDDARNLPPEPANLVPRMTHARNDRFMHETTVSAPNSRASHGRVGRIAPPPGAIRSTDWCESLHPGPPVEAVRCEMECSSPATTPASPSRRRPSRSRRRCRIRPASMQSIWAAEMIPASCCRQIFSASSRSTGKSGLTVPGRCRSPGRATSSRIKTAGAGLIRDLLRAPWRSFMSGSPAAWAAGARRRLALTGCRVGACSPVNQQQPVPPTSHFSGARQAVCFVPR
jgi:hypothetical protein